jgi:hypothetical protein
MANLIGLEWDDREARVVAGTSRGGSLVVEHAFSISWPAPAEGGKPTAPPAAEIGRRLADELTSRRIPRGEAIVAVSRTVIELKPMTLPPAPDEELPDMVRLQSQREFTTLHEGSPIDYIPLSGSATEPRNVLAAAISPELIKQVRQVCDGAGLKLVRLTLRPCGAAALLNRAHPKAERVRLLVDLMWDDADLTVLVGDQVTYLRTVRLPVDATTGDVARPLVSEIRRTMAAAQNQLGAQRVEAVYFCGDQRQSAAAEALGKSLEQPVRAFDPFQGLELGGALRSGGIVEASRFAPLLGTLSEEAAGARPAIDFLHPRRRPAQKTRTQRVRPLALAPGGDAHRLELRNGGRQRSAADQDRWSGSRVEGHRRDPRPDAKACRGIHRQAGNGCQAGQLPAEVRRLAHGQANRHQDPPRAAGRRGDSRIR